MNPISHHCALAMTLMLWPFVLGACQICLPMPKESTADRVLGADVVVFARENPEKPFSLRATEVLKGGLTDHDIDVFLDSRSRRILAHDSERKLLLVGNGEGGKRQWRRIGMTDSAGLYEKIVRKVLGKQAQWAKTPRDRPAFFRDYLGHADPQLRQLAHLEIARAPYSQISSYADAIPPETIRAFLDDVRNLEWQGLYILLLGQSTAEQDHERIREQARSSLVFGLTSQLSAWATAWIEIDGGEAIRFFTQHYLSKEHQDPELVLAVLSALSVHGQSGDAALRDDIIKGYASVIDAHPVLAPSLAKELVQWEQWPLIEKIITITGEDFLNLSLEDDLKLRAYRLSLRKTMPDIRTSIPR